MAGQAASINYTANELAYLWKNGAVLREREISFDYPLRSLFQRVSSRNEPTHLLRHCMFYGRRANKVLPRFQIRIISSVVLARALRKLASRARGSELGELNLNNRRKGDARHFCNNENQFLPWPAPRVSTPGTRSNAPAQHSMKERSYSKSCAHFREVHKFSELDKYAGQGDENIEWIDEPPLDPFVFHSTTGRLSREGDVCWTGLNRLGLFLVQFFLAEICARSLGSRVLE